jgi:type I restriction enzyme M protein
MNERPPSEIAAWIAEARVQKTLTQAALAREIGVSQAQISQWETGKQAPNEDHLVKLHALFGKPKARRAAAAPPVQLSLAAPAKASEPPPAPRRAAKGTTTPTKGSSAGSAAVLGFEEKLWEAADTLRGSMDPGEYKHVVLGLIFLKYISDAFELRYAALAAVKNADPEDKDEYTAENVFWVPQAARWAELQKAAKQPEIGTLIDKAMEAIEKENPALKSTLPKEYARPSLDKTRLGKLMDTMSNIDLAAEGHNTKDLLGRAYEYFLKKFASAEGRLGGDFYTPQSVVRVLVEMIAPYKGRVFDPCCGSGGMFVQSEKFVEAHGGSTRAANGELHDGGGLLRHKNVVIDGFCA